MAEGGIGIEIKQPVQERTDPVKEYATTADNWFNLWYRLGQATQRRLAGMKASNPQSVERSLHTRVERARLLAELKSGRKSKEEVNTVKQELDAFDRQLLNQGRFRIDLLGIQESQYVVVESVKGKEATESLPPVFLIPPLAGDLNQLGPLIMEVARQGRKVITVGYPESFMGKTTDAFAQVSEKTSNYEPHTTFFKRAIEAFFGQQRDLELWGYSHGAGLATEILLDPQFQKRVTNAVIIAPGGCLDQSKWDIIKGVLHEAKEVFFKNLGGFHDTGVTHALKEPIDKDQTRLRNRLLLSVLFDKVGRKINPWGRIRVKEGGKIIVVTGRKDEITKSYKANVELAGSTNHQITVLDYPNGSHLSSILHAPSVVSKIAEVRDNFQTQRLVVASFL